MRPKLSERARRLVDAINLLWAGRRAVAGLEALFTDPDDDAAYEADTRELEAARRHSAAFDARWRFLMAGCPIQGCRTCEPAVSGAEILAASRWLREHDYQAWSNVAEGKLQQIAVGLIELRGAVERGERVPG